MSDDFKVGDVVVCVDDGPCAEIPYAGFPFVLKLNSVHRVTGTDLLDGRVYLIIRGWRKYYFDASRFRKLPPADDAFVLRMREMKPRLPGTVREKEKEDA